MKTTLKKYMAFLLALVLVSLFASCDLHRAKEEGNSGNTDSIKNNSTAAGEESKPEETTLPISEKKLTLTMFLPAKTELRDLVDDMGATPFFQELEKRTGIHIKFQSPATGQETAAYNLMLSSGELPDIIYNDSSSLAYPDGLDAAVKDGYFLDLTELIPEYAPNYYKLLHTMSDVVARTARTDGGRLIGVYQIASKPQGPFYGLQIREDWLKELGLSMPVTYGDWENVLTLFKKKKGAFAPLIINASGYNYDNGINAGFNVTSSFMQINHTVSYGPIQEGWKEYLALMNKWYAKGLIDPDFMTQTSILPDNSMVTSGTAGAWSSFYTLPSSLYLPAMDKDTVISPVSEPVKTAGDKLHIRMNDFTVGTYYTISKNCKYPETALKWMDYLFSAPGSEFANYGIEGKTFHYVKGKPQFTQVIMKNSDGLSFNQACSFYTMPPAMPVLQDWTRELQNLRQKDISSFRIWSQADTDYLMPTGISMTSAENAEYAKIMADVTSYVNENTVSFITGVRPMSEFDEYTAAIESMGIDRATAIMQASLDRYLSR